MSSRLGRMPISPEMDAFQAEVCRDEKILVGGQSQYSTVIPDALDDRGTPGLGAPTVRVGCQASDFVDQRSFGEWHWPTIPLVICPMVTPDWRSSVTGTALMHR